MRTVPRCSSDMGRHPISLVAEATPETGIGLYRVEWMRCLYCEAPLEGVVRPAHVIPEGMGGRLASTSTVCNDCNNSFARIEGIACQRLATQGALVGALRGDREPITAVVTLEGSTYRAGRGRMDELAGPPTDRGRVYPMPARREDQIKVVVSALRARHLPPEALLDGRFKLEEAAAVAPIGETQAEPVEVSMAWCDRATKRVMTKAALELLAHLFPNEATRPELEGVRRFARYDEGDFFAGVDTSTAGAGLPLLDAPYVHAIEVWTAGMRCHYRMILFTELRFVGTLAEVRIGKALRSSYSFDVKDPANRRVIAESGDGATLVNKSQRVRQRELDVALEKLEELNWSTSARRRVRAPPPSFKDLYPDVVRAMGKRKS